MIIAIDGPSGSGKSSVSKEIARVLDILHLDTGAMYRLFAYKLFKENIEINDKNIENILEKFNIKLEKDRFYLDDIDVTKEIRQNEISKIASKISQNFKVREYMVNLQREIAKNRDVVLDGRDIASVVFPNADLKIFLTASSEVRARRRCEEDGSLDYNIILEDIIRRDYNDENRKYSPLKKVDDAILINTDNLSFNDVVNEILRLVKKL